MEPQGIEELRKTLSAWRGAGALVWLYRASHREFTLQLHRTQIRGNCHIVCSGCSFFASPSRWREANLAFDRVATDQPFPEYTLTDASSGFVARCANAKIEFNVDPIY